MSKLKSGNRSERQSHGFEFEDYIIKKHGLIKEKDYTAVWDAHTKSGIPVSIKISEIDSEICFGDIFRQAKMEVNGFYLIIGFWKDDTSNIQDVYIIPIKSKAWSKMFDEEAVKHLENMLDTAGNGNYHNKEDKELWVGLRDECKKVWKNNTLNILRPRFRWVEPDEGKHRIQCAIRYNSFVDNFINNDYFKKYVYNYDKPSSCKYTEVTETTITEDTKYGKSVTETKTIKTIEVDEAIQAHLRWQEVLKKKGEANRRRSEWK